jgi:hypothetical protein
MMDKRNLIKLSLISFLSGITIGFLGLIFMARAGELKQNIDIKSFTLGYREGYADAINKILQQYKALKFTEKDTEILRNLLIGKGKHYLSVFKVKCGKDYYLFTPVSLEDFPDLFRLSERKANFLQGWYVYIDTTDIPTEEAGLLKYLAKLTGLNPFWKGRLLVFSVESSEAEALNLKTQLNNLFGRYLKNPPKVVYTHITTKSDEAELLRQVENF